MVMTIGERVKAIRISKGLTQKDLEKKMYLTRSRVSSIETDRHVPGIPVLEMFAEALDVPVIRLIDDGDWEEVIRCRSCRNYEADRTCDLLNGLMFDPDDYCSYGERRKDG